MAVDRRYSSVFDALLDDGKQQLDALYGEASPRASRSTTPAPAPRPTRPSTDDWHSTPQAIRLNECFGDDWRFEIREQRREGDEVIVLGRLTVPRKNIVRSQFGRAARNAEAAATGSAGDLRFSLGATTRSSNARLDNAHLNNDSDGVRAAALDALEACAKLV